MLRGESETTLRKLGWEQEEMIQLLQIRTQKDFTSRFKVGHTTLAKWNDKIEKEGLDREIIGQSAHELTKNVVFALYRKAMSEGNAPEVKLWFQLFEGYVDRPERLIDAPELRRIADHLEALTKENK